MTTALLLVASYLLGATPTSFLAARYGAGIDLREHGSRNLGATNLYRVLGWRYAVPVGAFDVAKGAVPVLFFAGFAAPHPLARVGLGAAAVLGHVFPVYLRFQGGKGVATAAGAVLALAPAALGLSVIVWAITVAASGYVSLASMLAAVVFPLALRFVGPYDAYTFVLGVALAAFILVTHRSNIRRLLAGNENRFGRRRGEARR